jgi:MerR family copper efflux transcriptional regulator
MEERRILAGQLARSCGVTVRALRVYERRGLIAPAARGENGYRYFDPEVAQSIRVFGALLSLGIPLHEVGEVFASAIPIRGGLTPAQARDSMRRARAVYRRHIDAIDGEIARLARVRVILAQRVAYCSAQLTRPGPVTIGVPASPLRRVRPGRIEYVRAEAN